MPQGLTESGKNKPEVIIIDVLGFRRMGIVYLWVFLFASPLMDGWLLVAKALIIGHEHE